MGRQEAAAWGRSATRAGKRGMSVTNCHALTAVIMMVLCHAFRV